MYDIRQIRGAADGTLFPLKDSNGYISIGGIHFGTTDLPWGDLYRQTVGTDPNTKHPIELSGDGLIIDGYLNVDQISMNKGEISLGRYGGDGGFIYFCDGDNIQTDDARLAQVSINGQTRPVLAVQAYVSSGGKYGAWDLGSLDVSNLFVDHFIASSGSYGFTFFNDIRLCYSTDGQNFTGIHLYDSLNQSGNTGDVLKIASNGKPVWGAGGSGQWSAGVVTTLDSNYFQIINYSPNTITRVGYNRYLHASGTAISDTTSVGMTAGRVLVLTCAIGSYQGIQNVTQTGVSWSRATSFGYFGASPYVNGEIWVGIVGSGALANFTITFTGDTPAIADIMGYTGLNTSSPVETFQANMDTHSGSPTDTNTLYTSNANDLIVGCIAMPYSVTQSTPRNGFTLVGNSGANNVSLGTLELFTTVTGSYSSGTSTNGGTYVGMIVAFKASSQSTQQKLTWVGSGGGGSGGGASYSASSPIVITGNVISFNASNSDISVNSLTAALDVYCDHIEFNNVTGANLTSWSDTIYNSVFTSTQATSHGVQSSGDFYIPNSLKLAGLLQFNNGTKACGLIWSNDYTLSLIADSGSPFSYYTTKDPRTGATVSQYLAYFGALNVGAVYTQYINPIGTGSGITVGGNLSISNNLTLGSASILTDSDGVASSASGKTGYVLTVSSTGHPVWAPTQNVSNQNPTFLRSSITDFFTTPFWSNITDKPSTFAPSAHTSSHWPGAYDAIFDQSVNSGDNVTFGNVTANGYVSAVNAYRFGGDDYPCLGRNTTLGDNILEVVMPNGTQAADMIITGNLNVGRISGGLSVNGVIGLSGDLSGNCFIQFGTASTTSTGLISGAIRLAKTDAHVLSIQNYISGTWDLCNVDLSGLFCSWINGTNSGKYGPQDVVVSFTDLQMGANISGTITSPNIYPWAGGYCYVGSSTQYFAGGFFDYLMPGNASHRQIGSSSNKWNDIYCVNPHWGDAWFDNNFHLTEDGNDGVMLYSNTGVLMQRWSLNPNKDDIQTLHNRITELEVRIKLLEKTKKL